MESLRFLLCGIFGFLGVELVQRAGHNGTAWTLFLMMLAVFIAFGVVNKFGKD